MKLDMTDVPLIKVKNRFTREQIQKLAQYHQTKEHHHDRFRIMLDTPVGKLWFWECADGKYDLFHVGDISTY